MKKRTLVQTLVLLSPIIFNVLVQLVEWYKQAEKLLNEQPKPIEENLSRGFGNRATNEEQQ